MISLFKKTTLFKKKIANLLTLNFFSFLLFSSLNYCTKLLTTPKSTAEQGERKNKNRVNLSNQYITPLIHTDVYNTSGMLP